MKINKEQLGRKPSLKRPLGMKKALWLILMAFISKMGINADPVWATIVDINSDLTGEFYLYFFDKDDDGLEDGVVRIQSSHDTASIFKRYIQVGGRVLYEDDNKDNFDVLDSQLLRIETLDGRLIKVADFTSRYANYYRRARDFEARQRQHGE